MHSDANSGGRRPAPNIPLLLAILLVLAALALVLSACGGDAADATSQPSDTSSGCRAVRLHRHQPLRARHDAREQGLRPHQHPRALRGRDRADGPVPPVRPGGRTGRPAAGGQGGEDRRLLPQRPHEPHRRRRLGRGGLHEPVQPRGRLRGAGSRPGTRCCRRPRTRSPHSLANELRPGAASGSIPACCGCSSVG